MIESLTKEMLAETNPASTVAAIIGIGLFGCWLFTAIFGNGKSHHRDTEYDKAKSEIEKVKDKMGIE